MNKGAGAALTSQQNRLSSSPRFTDTPSNGSTVRSLSSACRMRVQMKIVVSSCCSHTNVVVNLSRPQPRRRRNTHTDGITGEEKKQATIKVAARS